MSASNAPRITTVDTSRRSAMASKRLQNVRQRMFGSAPCIRTTSRCEPGGEQ
ncbi:Uncharacterised protein [Mycobacteroides abscessus subsp. abscessus]|nr:Uncharacterised protein [Mycobacteroides abscessus subsp. abscessus]